MSESKIWRLVNPEGIVPAEKSTANTRPSTLEGKTVVFHWNGKHNGDVFLNRIRELLVEKVKNITIVNGWEHVPEAKGVSQNPEVSKQVAQKLAELKPDIVIGAQGD